MSTLTRLLILVAVLCAAADAGQVDVPRGVNHEAYDRLLKKYVNDRGLVNYSGWKKSDEDLKALRDYLAQFDKPAPFADGNEKAASLINAYNALTIQWILDNYPTKSIKATSNPWGAKRWRVGGRVVSLDEIEHDTLRPLLGYRVHAGLVCAAKSCPPLRNAAYEPDQPRSERGKLEAQLDERMMVWLARDDLNRFVPDKDRVELSKIFDWYGKDFGDLRAVLAKYAPDWKGKFDIEFQRYDWELNEQPPVKASR